MICPYQNFDESRALKVLVVPIGENSAFDEHYNTISKLKSIPLFDLSKPSEWGKDVSNYPSTSKENVSPYKHFSWQNGNLLFEYMRYDRVSHGAGELDYFQISRKIVMVMGLINYPEVVPEGLSSEEGNKLIEQEIDRFHRKFPDAVTRNIFVFNFSFTNNSTPPRCKSRDPLALVIFPPEGECGERDTISSMIEIHLREVMSNAAVYILLSIEAQLLACESARLKKISASHWSPFSNSSTSRTDIPSIHTNASTPDSMISGKVIRLHTIFDDCIFDRVDDSATNSAQTVDMYRKQTYSTRAHKRPSDTSTISSLTISSSVYDQNRAPLQFVYNSELPSGNGAGGLSNFPNSPNPNGGAHTNSPNPNSSSTAKKGSNEVGRVKKRMGDLCLQMCSPMDSLEHYAAAIQECRASGDLLWLAGALEGYAASIYVCSVMNMPFEDIIHKDLRTPMQAVIQQQQQQEQMRNYMESTVGSSGRSHEQDFVFQNLTGATGFNSVHVPNMCSLLNLTPLELTRVATWNLAEERALEAIQLYSRNIVLHGLEVECCLKLARMHVAGICRDKDQKALNCIMRAVSIQGLNNQQQVECILEGAFLCKKLKLNRKYAMLLHLAALMSGENGNPALAFELSTRACEVYGIPCKSYIQEVRSSIPNSQLHSETESQCLNEREQENEDAMFDSLFDTYNVMLRRNDSQNPCWSRLWTSLLSHSAHVAMEASYFDYAARCLSANWHLAVCGERARFECRKLYSICMNVPSVNCNNTGTTPWSGSDCGNPGIGVASELNEGLLMWLWKDYFGDQTQTLEAIAQYILQLQLEQQQLNDLYSEYYRIALHTPDFYKHIPENADQLSPPNADLSIEQYAPLLFKNTLYYQQYDESIGFDGIQGTDDTKYGGGGNGGSISDGGGYGSNISGGRVNSDSRSNTIGGAGFTVGSSPMPVLSRKTTSSSLQNGSVYNTPPPPNAGSISTPIPNGKTSILTPVPSLHSNYSDNVAGKLDLAPRYRDEAVTFSSSVGSGNGDSRIIEDHCIRPDSLSIGGTGSAVGNLGTGNGFPHRSVLSRSSHNVSSTRPVGVGAVSASLPLPIPGVLSNQFQKGNRFLQENRLLHYLSKKLVTGMGAGENGRRRSESQFNREQMSILASLRAGLGVGFDELTVEHPDVPLTIPYHGYLPPNCTMTEQKHLMLGLINLSSRVSSYLSLQLPPSLLVSMSMCPMSIDSLFERISGTPVCSREDLSTYITNHPIQEIGSLDELTVEITKDTGNLYPPNEPKKSLYFDPFKKKARANPGVSEILWTASHKNPKNILGVSQTHGAMVQVVLSNNLGNPIQFDSMRVLLQSTYDVTYESFIHRNVIIPPNCASYPVQFAVGVHYKYHRQQNGHSRAVVKAGIGVGGFLSVKGVEVTIGNAVARLMVDIQGFGLTLECDPKPKPNPATASVPTKPTAVVVVLPPMPILTLHSVGALFSQRGVRANQLNEVMSKLLEGNAHLVGVADNENEDWTYCMSRKRIEDTMLQVSEAGVMGDVSVTPSPGVVHPNSPGPPSVISLFLGESYRQTLVLSSGADNVDFVGLENSHADIALSGLEPDYQLDFCVKITETLHRPNSESKVKTYVLKEYVDKPSLKTSPLAPAPITSTPTPMVQLLSISKRTHDAPLNIEMLFCQTDEAYMDGMVSVEVAVCYYVVSKLKSAPSEFCRRCTYSYEFHCKAACTLVDVLLIQPTWQVTVHERKVLQSILGIGQRVWDKRVRIPCYNDTLCERQWPRVPLGSFTTSHPLVSTWFPSQSIAQAMLGSVQGSQELMVENQRITNTRSFRHPNRSTVGDPSAYNHVNMRTSNSQTQHQCMDSRLKLDLNVETGIGAKEWDTTDEFLMAGTEMPEYLRHDGAGASESSNKEGGACRTKPYYAIKIKNTSQYPVSVYTHPTKLIESMLTERIRQSRGDGEITVGSSFQDKHQDSIFLVNHEVGGNGETKSSVSSGTLCETFSGHYAIQRILPYSTLNIVLPISSTRPDGCRLPRVCAIHQEHSGSFSPAGAATRSQVPSKFAYSDVFDDLKMKSDQLFYMPPCFNMHTAITTKSMNGDINSNCNKSLQLLTILKKYKYTLYVDYNPHRDSDIMAMGGTTDSKLGGVEIAVIVMDARSGNNVHSTVPLCSHYGSNDVIVTGKHRQVYPMDLMQYDPSTDCNASSNNVVPIKHSIGLYFKEVGTYKVIPLVRSYTLKPTAYSSVSAGCDDSKKTHNVNNSHAECDRNNGIGYAIESFGQWHTMPDPVVVQVHA